LLVSIFGLCCSLSFFSSWLYLVLGSVTTTVWLKNKVGTHPLSVYFISTICGSLLFLLSSLPVPGSNLILILSLLLLLGVAPFHFWTLKLLPFFSFQTTILFLGPLKTGYLFVLIGLEYLSSLYLLPSLILGLLLFWVSTSVYSLFFASSSCTIFLVGILGPWLGSFYFFLYLEAIFILLSINLQLISPLLALLSLAGFPPLTMFWAKVSALVLSPAYIGFLVLITSAAGLYPYLCFGITHIFKVRGGSTSATFLFATQGLSLLASYYIIH